VGITAGSTEVPGRKPVTRDNNNNNNIIIIIIIIIISSDSVVLTVASKLSECLLTVIYSRFVFLNQIIYHGYSHTQHHNGTQLGC
jgi:hypothetical protein